MSQPAATGAGKLLRDRVRSRGRSGSRGFKPSRSAEVSSVDRQVRVFGDSSAETTLGVAGQPCDQLAARCPITTARSEAARFSMAPYE